MYNNLKKLLAVTLVIIIGLNCFASVTSEAENKESTEAVQYTKTFENSTGGGTLYIKDVNGNVLKKLGKGEKVTYKYPSDKSPDEVYIKAVANDGYVIDSYMAKWLLNGQRIETCESVYEVNKKTYERGHFLETAEFDEVFSVSFVKKAEEDETVISAVSEIPDRVMATASAPDISNPTIGDSFTGKATITYNGRKTDYYNGSGYITCTSGDFENDKIVLSTCASGHDYWAPVTGQTGTYTITVTSVNKDSGEVTCTVMWKNSQHGVGYQNLSGTYSFDVSFGGGFLITKEAIDEDATIAGTKVVRYMNAIFNVYSDKECTKKVATLKTDKFGITDNLDVDAGTYYVKETTAPEGYAINQSVFTVKIGKNSNKLLSVKDNILRAKISGVKIDAETGESVPTPGLSLAGAVYRVYMDASCSPITLCNEGVSDANGNIEFKYEYLAYGTYYIKEFQAPKGYDIDPTVYEVVVDEKLGYYPGSTYRLNDISFTSVDAPQLGKGKIIKRTTNEDITSGNSCYSLAGCKFQLTSLDTGEVVPETLVTNEKGETQEITLAVGSYSVKEIEAPKGFTLSNEELVIQIKKDQTTTVDFKDEPTNDPVYVLLKKVDAETGTEVTTGAGELAGAEYTFKYYDGQYTTESQLTGVVPTRTWVLATDEDGLIYFRDAKKVSGDAFYVDSDGNRTLPLGTVTIQETKAPEGYNKDETLYIQNITADSKGAIVKSYQTPTSAESVIRGDLKGIKVSAGDMKRLANVPFKITSVASGESHIVVTDVNGVFDTSSSWNLHSVNTNRGKTSADGIWFGDMEKLDDDAGALPYGSYIIEELSCEANKDKVLIEPFEVAVTKDSTIVDLGTLVNEYIPVPDISTSATDKNTGQQVTYAGKNAAIVDEVTYTNLTKGAKYTLKGVLMNTETGKPLLVNGEQVTSQKTFSTSKIYGTTELEFTFDASGLEGMSTTVFEYLYYGNELVAEHADITDKKQTIKFKAPSIGTSATDKASGKRTAEVSEKTTIVDKVTYKNLVAGEEHIIKGILMDTATNEPLLINGKQVTVEDEFIATSSKGYVSLEYTFDSTALKGKKVTVFEYLYYGNELIAEHTDITDEKQTVEFEDEKATTESTTESTTEPTTEPTTAKKTPKTGDNTNVGIILILMVVFFGGGVLLFCKSRRIKKHDETAEEDKGE